MREFWRTSGSEGKLTIVTEAEIVVSMYKEALTWANRRRTDTAAQRDQLNVRIDAWGAFILHLEHTLTLSEGSVSDPRAETGPTENPAAESGFESWTPVFERAQEADAALKAGFVFCDSMDELYPGGVEWQPQPPPPPTVDVWTAMPDGALGRYQRGHVPSDMPDLGVVREPPRVLDQDADSETKARMAKKWALTNAQIMERESLATSWRLICTKCGADTWTEPMGKAPANAYCTQSIGKPPGYCKGYLVIVGGVPLEMPEPPVVVPLEERRMPMGMIEVFQNDGRPTWWHTVCARCGTEAWIPKATYPRGFTCNARIEKTYYSVCNGELVTVGARHSPPDHSVLEEWVYGPDGAPVEQPGSRWPDFGDERIVG